MRLSATTLAMCLFGLGAWGGEPTSESPKTGPAVDKPKDDPAACPACKGSGKAEVGCEKCRDPNEPAKRPEYLKARGFPLPAGTGSAQCQNCKGKFGNPDDSHGFIACQQCKGMGVVLVRTGQVTNTPKCPSCGGTKGVKCPKCKDGTVKCPECKGTGKTEAVCYRCHGTCKDPFYIASDNAVLVALVRKLGDTNESVIYAAAETLGNMGPDAKDAVPFLIKAFDSTAGAGDPRNDMACRVLPKFGAATVPEIAKALESKDSLMRYKACWVLGQIGPVAKDTLPAVIKLLDDPDATVRTCAAEAVGQISKAPKTSGGK